MALYNFKKITVVPSAKVMASLPLRRPSARGEPLPRGGGSLVPRVRRALPAPRCRRGLGLRRLPLPRDAWDRPGLMLLGPAACTMRGGVWMGVGVGVPVREGHCGLRRDPGAAFLHRPAGVSGWSLQKSPVFQPRVMLSLIPARSFQMKFSPSLNEGAFVKTMVREAPRGVLGLLCFVGICHVTARAAAVAAVDGRPTLSQLK